LGQRITRLGRFGGGLDVHFGHAPGLENADLAFAQFAARRSEEHPIQILHLGGDHHPGL